VTAKLNTTVLAPVGPDKPLLVVSPSLGTSAVALWEDAAKFLAGSFGVVGIDLPGHGASKTVAPLTDMASLARAALASAEEFANGKPFYFAGVSVSGCITLQLLLDAPEMLAGAIICNSAAKIGEHAGWMERAEYVRGAGTEAMRAASPDRWFAPGFMERNPARAEALLDSLVDADAGGYAGVCEALATFDVRAQLASISRPVLVIGGENDVATPPEQQRFLADTIPGAGLRVLSRVAHLAPAENPEGVAEAVKEYFTL